VNSIDVSVIVPTHNQAEALALCLPSLLAQTLSPDRYEILVVDDGSTDETAAVLAHTSAPVRTVRLQRNRGRSGARNAGVRDARADLVLFVDSDVVVPRDFVEWHLRTQRTHGAGILSRGPVVPVSTLAGAQQRRAPWLASSPAYLDTANAALERQAVMTAGMFDEAFPGYGWEDFELGYRLRAAGIRRVFCRRAVAFHLQPVLHGGAMDALFAKEESRARSAMYFYRKHPTLETRLLIQATPVHRVLYWLLAGAGGLHRGNLPQVMDRLRRAGLGALAPLAARSVLNRHYLGALTQEFAAYASTMA
jgi:GT2 family glycosyltransferase